MSVLKIEVKNHVADQIVFANLKVGEVFIVVEERFEYNYYIKTEEEALEPAVKNAFCLTAQSTCWLRPETIVTPVKSAVLSIEG